MSASAVDTNAIDPPQGTTVNNDKFVSLPLDAKGRSVIKKLSSDEFLDLTSNTFLPIDLLLTVPLRYDRLCEHDATLEASIEGDPAYPNAHTPDTQGATIDYTSQHTPYAILIILAIAGAAAANYYRTYKRIQRDQQDQSYHYVYKKLVNSAADPDSKNEETKESSMPAFFQENVRQALQENPDLREKYADVIVESNKKIKFKFNPGAATPQQPSQKTGTKAALEAGEKYFLNGVVWPLWNMIGIMSFSYWLLWMATALFTKHFDVGITGLPLAVGFGIPLAFGAVYLAFRARDAYKQYKMNKPVARPDQHPDVTLGQRANVKKDALILLRAVMRIRKNQSILEKARAEVGAGFVETELKVVAHSTTLNNTLKNLGENALAKGTTTFVSKTSSTFINLQYGSWIITDILAKVFKVVTDLPIINLIAGWGIIGLSLLNGIYRGGVKAFQVLAKKDTMDKERKSMDKELLAMEGNVMTLETMYKQKLQEFNELKMDVIAQGKCIPSYMPQFKPITDKRFFADNVRPAPNDWTKVKKFLARTLDFMNNCMSGIFILRVLIVKNTAIYLPFKALGVALAKVMVGAGLTASAFTGTILPILFVGGALFAAFKLYEYNRARKEKRIQALYDQRKEKLAHLKEQIKVVDACTQVLKKKTGAVPTLVKMPPAVEEKIPGARVPQPTVHYGTFVTPTVLVRDFNPQPSSPSSLSLTASA